MIDRTAWTSMEEDAPFGGAVPPGGTMSIGERTFWLVFWGGWLAYGLLFLFAYRLQRIPWGQSLSTATLALASVCIASVFVALRRDRILGPEVTIRRFLARRCVEGFAFALVAGTATYLTFTYSPFEHPVNTEFGQQGWGLWFAWVLNAAVLYVILSAFLTGTEALNRLDELRTRAAREAVLRAEAEAQAVRARFNPHFVFNTLHSLMLLVRAEPDTAERAIENVAELIRYASTLQRRQIDQVTLAKELDFARRYLALEKLRLADRLTVDWQMDAGVESTLVPAFSLQTLLENAIKHGIAPKPEGGRVLMRARVIDGVLELTVSDDGCGAPARMVPEGDGGSGLRLLSDRLATTYGGAAGLSWSTAPGKGFEVTVRVPARDAPSGGP